MNFCHTQSSYFFVFLIGLILTSFRSSATEYTVSSDDEFNDLTLVAGDIVTWLDGTYADQQINWNGQSGTAENPITLKAETSGAVIFTGSSKVNFYGNHLIVQGFYWKGGEGANNHIEFRRNGSDTDFGSNCTIRNCAFDNLYTEEPGKSRWIVLYGSENTVENCTFLNKESTGALLLIELSYSQNTTPGHIIRNNYFYNITPKDNFDSNSNDSEAIRIGESSYQATSAQVVVEGNYFQKADGENEIISNKSADNTFRHNTFRNCRGSLVMRHGARAHVEGNFFLGEGKDKSGGIRISDRDHVIINNYMQGLKNDGDKWNNAITLVGGGAASGGTSNGYQNVDNLTIAYNTIYDSDDPIFFNNRDAYDPTGVIAYNLVYSENGDIVAGDIAGTGQGMTYEGNIFGGSDIGISNDGIIEGNAEFTTHGETYKPSSIGLAANAASSAYNDIVNIDVEGLVRPKTDLDVGAHEVSGASGSINYRPITDADVGTNVGACFIGADGSVLEECGASGNYLIASQVPDFDNEGSTESASITSNVSWTVTEDHNWISVTPISGTGNGRIDITVSPHSNSVERTGTITIRGDGIEDKSISVIQAAYEPPINVTGVTLTEADGSIAVGGTLQLRAAVAPADATNQKVVFESDDISVATVSESGLVTGVSEGTVTVTVTTDEGGFSDTITINIVALSSEMNWAMGQPVSGTGTADGANLPANLVDGDTDSRWSVQEYPQSATVDLGGDITISQIEVVCFEGRAYQFTVEGAITENGTFTTIVDMSNNTTPGTVTAPIISAVDGVEARYVKITVSGADVYSGQWVSLTELRVFGEGEREEVLVSGVAMDIANVELLEGETQQLTATVSPSHATNKEISFSSEDASIASVDTNGLVIAVSEGTATITVTTEDGSYLAWTEITVVGQILSLYDGASHEISLTPNPANATVNIRGAEKYHIVSIYDPAGKMVFQQGIGNTKFLNVSGLRAGIYLLKIEGNGKVHVSRLIKR